MLSLQQSLFGDEPNYFSAGVPASKFPERHFCSVCGYPFYVDIDSEIWSSLKCCKSIMINDNTFVWCIGN